MSNNNHDRISSSGMDRKIDKKTWTPKRIAMVLGGIAIASLLIYSFVFMDTRSTLNVDRRKLTISTIHEDTFQEFILVTGTIQPIQAIYLDAVEGGVVENIYRESDSIEEKGNTLLTLSNSDLSLKVFQQSSSIYDQIHQTRNSRLNMEQNSFSLKERLAEAEKQLAITESNFNRQTKLYEKNLIAEQAFMESKENYEYQKERYELTYESFKQDSIKSQQQMQQIDELLDRMWRSQTTPGRLC